MAAPRSIQFKHGECVGEKFIFDSAGDELPVHLHPPGDNHLSVVAVGEFELLGNNSLAGQTRGPGSVILWNEGESHGYRATKAGSVVVNVKTGKTSAIIAAGL